MRKYATTIILCGLIAVLTAPIHAGFLLFFVVPFFVIWVAFSLYVIWCKPERRPSQIGKIAIWIVVLSAIACVHFYYATMSRRDAEQVATALMQYKVQHATFPESLSAVGLDAQSLKKRWMLYYWIKDDQPMLLYATTFTPFDTYSYDFSKREWLYRPD